LGKFSADLRQHIIEVQKDEQVIEIKGDVALSQAVTSLKPTRKELRNEA